MEISRLPEEVETTESFSETNLRYGRHIAVMMGISVFLINYIRHDALSSLIAGGKQLGYSWIAAETLIRIHNQLYTYFTERGHKNIRRYIASVLSPVAGTTALTYLTHSYAFEETPEIFWSTVPTLITALGGYTASYAVRSVFEDFFKEIDVNFDSLFT